MADKFLKTSLNDIVSRTTSDSVETAAVGIKPNFKINSLQNLLNRKAGTYSENTESSPELSKRTEEKQVTSKPDEITANKNLRKDLNWRQELADRIKANDQALPGEKVEEEKIYQEFWYDYFCTLWSKELYPFLNALGDIFKKDLRTWGFDADLNPMVAFLLQKYVQNTLLKTKLLNKDTYKAFHNAIIKKYLSVGELRKLNNYNIIYNVNLYKKLPADIYNYLKLQTQILAPKKASYSIKEQSLNRRIMLQNDNVTAGDPNTRLNSLLNINIKSVPKSTEKVLLNSVEDISLFLELLGHSNEPKQNTQERTSMDTDEVMEKLDITTPGEAYQLLAYLSAQNNDEKILAFLNENSQLFAADARSAISVKDLLNINKLLSNVKLDTTEVLNYISRNVLKL